jgi:large subunit ribosomal protein L25
MQTIDLSAAKRADLGKASTKQLRKDEQVPCVLYGGKENIHFSAKVNEFRKLLYTPHVYIVNLKVDKTKYSAVVKDIQFHPVTDEILHVDFLQVTEDVPMIIEIPVALTGFAEGVKAGGKLTLEIRKLKVKALAKNLPDTLDIKIDTLALGKTIKVGELKFPNLEILNAKNAVVVSVKLTRAARAAQQGS